MTTAVLTIHEIDLLIDAAAQGASKFTLPSGVVIEKPNLEALMKLREHRKPIEDANEGGIVAQNVEFG